jgi:hypothetical protein
VTNDELLQRIRDLEEQLDRYHSRLEDAIDRRDILTFDAASAGVQGIIGAILYCGGTALFVWAADHYDWPWFIAVPFGVAAYVFLGWMIAKTGEAYDRDRGNLAKLPEWSSFYDRWR